MLILTRKLGETIAIGDEIKITFLDMKGNQLRIGVEAPRKIPVYRGEIYRQITEQNMRAAAVDTRLLDMWEKLTSREDL